MEQDKELCERVASRDQEALEILYRRYFKRLTRFVAQITRDPQAALEVVNDVFFIVWNSANRFRGDSSFSTWVMGIAYNKAMNSVSRKPNWVSVSEISELEESDPKADLIEDEIQVLMKKLRPDQRAIIELTYYYGYTYKEIAEILNCPENTVKTRMFNARKQMKHRREADNEY